MWFDLHHPICHPVIDQIRTADQEAQNLTGLPLCVAVTGWLQDRTHSATLDDTTPTGHLVYCPAPSLHL